MNYCCVWDCSQCLAYILARKECGMQGNVRAIQTRTHCCQRKSLLRLRLYRVALCLAYILARKGCGRCMASYIFGMFLLAQ